MTTVVFDGYTLAADKMTVSTDTRHNCVHCGKSTSKRTEKTNKIIIPTKDIIYKEHKLLAIAFAGPSNIKNIFIELMEHISDFSTIVKIVSKTLNANKSFSGIAIFEGYLCKLECRYKTDIGDDKNYLTIKGGEIPEDVKSFAAIGSGALPAKIAYEEFNMPAKACIIFASKYNESTSAFVDTFVYKEYPPAPTTEEIVSNVEKVIEKKIKAVKKK